MSSQASNEPVLIIGGGLSGLALGHALKSHGIPFQVFERESSPLFRAQGYRIRIQDYYLKQLLSAETWTKLENCCAEFIPGGVRLDAITGQAPATEGLSNGESRGPPRPVMAEGKPLNVDRRVLRSLMLEPLIEEGLVQFGKKFEKYEVLGNVVIAHFADGSYLSGRLLIGADGSRSAVRKQMLPDFPLYDTEGRAIYGKTLIDKNIWKRLPPGIDRGMSMLSDTRTKALPIRLLCEVMHFVHREEAGLELPQDYLYWVMSMNKIQHKMDDDEFMRLSGDGSMAAALAVTETWHASCQAIVRTQVPDQVSTLAFAITDPELKDWPVNGKVTLMGDAAHPMTPVGGVGANAAFQDATLILEAILAGASVDRIAAYEHTMRQNARRYIAASIQGSTHVFGMKPFERLCLWTKPMQQH